MSLATILLIITHVVIAPLAAGHALLYKRDSRAAFGWVSACVLFPVLGPIAYGLFGINRVQSRARQMHGHLASRSLVGFERESAFQPLSPDTQRHSSLPDWLVPVQSLSNAVTSNPLVAGNEVTPLFNGERAFPRMLECIDAAESSVLLMTYLFDTDRTGLQFIDALARAVRRGVDVRVVLDGFGERYSRPPAGVYLAKAGIRVERFLPIRLLPPSLYLNLRNHRKLLVVDHTAAFAGGMNIGDRHLVQDPNNPRPTQDLHFEFSGTIVTQLSRVFCDTWAFVTGEILTLPEFLKPESGTDQCRAIVDGPDDNLDKLEIVLIGAISAARKSIAIMTPYFLPSREFISALKTAALKGVSVVIILPEKGNLPYVQWATQNVLGELLQHGIRVLRQPSPFCHSKVFVVDDCYCVVGSANIDARSLRLNFELGVEIVSDRLAAVLTDHFLRRAAASTEYTLEEVDGRSLPVRLRDAFCWLFQPYL